MNGSLAVALVATAVAPLAAQEEATVLKPEDVRHGTLKPEHLQDAVFVSVDLQEIPHVKVREEDVAESHRAQGVDAADVNAANDVLFETAFPNAGKLAPKFRELGIPVVLIHWGYRFKDAMDLDPVVRQLFLESYGTNWERWPHHIDHPTSRPAKILDPQPSDYVIPKTAQDAFTSSNIDFVLKNLGAKNLFLIGGHTNGCLQQTGQSAVEHGYFTICVEDATWDFAESRRLRGIKRVDFDIVCTTADVLAALEK